MEDIASIIDILYEDGMYINHVDKHNVTNTCRNEKEVLNHIRNTGTEMSWLHVMSDNEEVGKLLVFEREIVDQTENLVELVQQVKRL